MIKRAFPIELGVTGLRENTGLVRCKVPGSIRTKQDFENRGERGLSTGGPPRGRQN